MGDAIVREKKLKSEGRKLKAKRLKKFFDVTTGIKSELFKFQSQLQLYRAPDLNPNKSIILNNSK
jgi:hypothetical protein